MKNLPDTQNVALSDESFSFAFLAGTRMLEEAAQTVDGNQVTFESPDDANFARQTLSEARAALAKLDAAFGA
jgi:alkanesulfonate monooxygenase SsuD/methylene tetrahydromethanopterin reductase-like flavin-dependent oxidoreductase (luciferase family)